MSKACGSTAFAIIVCSITKLQLGLNNCSSEGVVKPQAGT